MILHYLKVVFSPKLWNPRMAHPDWNKGLTDVKSLFVYFPIIIKCCFCLRFFVFLSLDLLFFSYHFQFLFFSDSLTMHCLVLILFLIFSFHLPELPVKIFGLLDWQGFSYIISWHTFLCLFHCHFMFLSTWVIFPPFHTQDAENIQEVYAFFSSQEYSTQKKSPFWRKRPLTPPTEPSYHAHLLLHANPIPGLTGWCVLKGPAVPVKPPHWGEFSGELKPLGELNRCGTPDVEEPDHCALVEDYQCITWTLVT